MANVNDYIAWRGDLKISRQNPLNDVDSLALARFSYMPFSFIKMDKVETVESIAKKLKNVPKKAYVWPDDRDLAQLMGRSRRFSQIKVTDYVEKQDAEIAKQFAAVTLHINRSELYVSYIGTNENLFGWKEDFNMAFMDIVPAQEEASIYFNYIAKKYPWKKFRLGGHSKGGNVAMYAAIMASDIIQRRIIKVYNFDGPGLSKQTLARQNLNLILPKIQSYIPQDSIIGRLFDHAEKFEVVKSNANNFYQHDIYSWEISGTEMVPAKITKRSDMVDKTLTKWIEGMTVEQKKLFIDIIFGIFSENKLQTPRQFAENWTKYLPKLFKTYRGISKEDRKVVTDTAKRLVGSYLAVRRDEKK